jgi:hypothetical protein
MSLRLLLRPGPKRPRPGTRHISISRNCPNGRAQSPAREAQSPAPSGKWHQRFQATDHIIADEKAQTVAAPSRDQRRMKMCLSAVAAALVGVMSLAACGSTPTSKPGPAESPSPCARIPAKETNYGHIRDERPRSAPMGGALLRSSGAFSLYQRS